MDHPLTNALPRTLGNPFDAWVRDVSLEQVSKAASSLRKPLNNFGGFFYILPSIIPSDVANLWQEILEENLTCHLKPIQASIQSRWISSMQKNFSEKFGKTMNVESIIFDGRNPAAQATAEEIGLLDLTKSKSLHEFAEAVTGLELESGWGTQVIRYIEGNSVGPHNDHHPEYEWAKDGYIDIQIMLPNSEVKHQWFIHEESGFLSRIWDLNQNGAVSIFRQPFWHQTTPLVGRENATLAAKRWVIGQVFRIKASQTVSALRQSHEVEEAAYRSVLDRSVRLSPKELNADAHDVDGVQGCRLSKSGIWDAQLNYYQARGREAWFTGAVPSRVSTSPALAAAYARAAAEIMRKMPKRNLIIVEWGGGTGRFAFLFLKIIGKLAPQCKISYYLTDGASSNVKAMQQDERLKEFFDNGILYVNTQVAERFDQIIPDIASTTDGPVMVVGNYFVDSIPSDIFRVRGSAIEEGLVSGCGAQGTEVESQQQKRTFREMTWLGDGVLYQPAAAPYYNSEAINYALDQHRALKDGTSFLFPISALECIEAAVKTSKGPLIFLFADKGYYTRDALSEVPVPSISAHESISISVNFYALNRFFQFVGGRFYSCRSNRTAFGIAAAEVRSGNIWSAFADALEQGIGDVNLEELDAIIDAAASEHAKPSAALGALRMSNNDPLAMVRLSAKLREFGKTADSGSRDRIVESVMSCWDYAFGLPQEYDLAFTLGTILHSVGAFCDAAEFYRRSLDVSGPDADTFFNLGMCLRAQGDFSGAIAQFERALALDGGYEAARQRISELDGV